MLLTLPSEILSQVAFHLCSDTLSPPVALLQTCKDIHAVLAPNANPGLYARIFRSAFDSAAAERRSIILDSPLIVLRPGANDSAGGEEEDEMVAEGRRRLKAADLTAELRRRAIALKRAAKMVRDEDVTGLAAQELWVIYIMLVENDGKNLVHLLGSRAKVPLPDMLQLYLDQNLIPASIAPGYPNETTERALAIWIAWLLSRVTCPMEDRNERDERQFVLRPYVFAAQQYASYFAPWTLSNLPLIATPGAAGGGGGAGQRDPSPFVADLSPRSRRVQLEWYGQTISLSPPILSLAAMQWFFFRQRSGDARKASADARAAGRVDLSASNSGIAQVMGLFGGGGPRGLLDEEAVLEGETDDLDDDDDDDDDMSDTSLADVGPVDLLSSSLTHDRDFHRLLACYDPAQSLGMPRATWRNSWNGCWEGTFSFFEFDAFRGMLAGQLRALYEGSYGEQAQVWKLKETYVRPIRERTPKSKPAVVFNKGKGKAKAGVSAEEAGAPGLPLTGPMTNAGFPTNAPSASAMSSEFAWWGSANASAEAAQLAETLKQQMQALPGYEVVAEEDVEEALEEDDKEMEMLLTGTGHSAWGKFILKGRVRAWDGLATLVKEYTPDSRGKWVYRGYILAGNVFVGRWRDTFTPEEFVGYEGTFILNRR